MTFDRSRARSHAASRSPELLTTIAGLCDTIIEAGILLAVIVAPLYFNPRTQHTFEPDKAALLRSVVLIAVLAWVIRWGMENGKGKMERGKWTSLFATPISIFPVLLLGVYVIGTAASVLPRVSFWGAYERGQGLYTFVFYIGLFFLVRQTFRTPARRRRVIDTILLVSVPISVYAVLQHFGLDPLSFQTGGVAVTVRALSTLGNPIFLGAYLLMVIPLTMLRAYRAWRPAADDQVSPRLVAGLYGVLLLLQLAALFFAQSRGPTLGLIGGLGFGALVGAARRRARQVMVGAVAIVVIGVVVMSLLPALAPGTTRLGRLGQLVDPASRTGRQRLLVWEGVVNLVTAEPARTWVGYGPETLRDMVGPYLPDEIAGLKPDEDFDRAHNAALDLRATTWLLGVAAYLLVIGALLHHGLRNLDLVSGARDRWLFPVLALVGTLAGGLVPWLGVGRQWIAVGLPLGLLAGAGAFVVWRGLGSDRPRTQLAGGEMLTMALLAAVVGHVVETLVGIAIVATQTLFWVYAALIAALSKGAGEQRGGGAEEQRSIRVPVALLIPLGAVLRNGEGGRGKGKMEYGEGKGENGWGMRSGASGLVVILGNSTVRSGFPRMGARGNRFGRTKTWKWESFQ